MRLYKLEALLWMIRPHFLMDSVFYVTCGWFISVGEFHSALLVICLSVWLGRAAGWVLNDIVDYTKDLTTAPEMPLPAGLLSLREAKVFAAVLVGGAVAFGMLSARTVVGLVGIPLLYLASGLLNFAYSKLKGTGIWASLAVSVQISFAGVAGWLAAGAGNGWLFAVAFVAMTVFGIRQNLIAGIRDIDTDPTVGNTTTAVRLGLAGSVRWVLLLAASTATLLAGVGLVRGNLLGAGFCMVAAAAALWSIPGMTARFQRDTIRTRASRSADLRILAGRCYAVTVAFPMVASIWAGIATYVFHRAIITLFFPLYQKRLLEGGLRAAVERERASHPAAMPGH